MIEQRGETGALSLHRRRRGVEVGGVERGLSALTGAALLVTGVRRRNASGLALALGGAVLLARGATGRCPVYHALGVATAAPQGDERGVALMRSVTIAGTPEDIVAAARATSRWLPPEVETEPVDPGRWRVALRLPGGRRLETQVELRLEEDCTFSWRSTPGAGFEHQGRAFFGAAPARRGTELRIVLSMRPAVRRLRPGAERALGYGLRRLAQLVEAGEVATAATRPAPRAAGREAVA